MSSFGCLAEVDVGLATFRPPSACLYPSTDLILATSVDFKLCTSVTVLYVAAKAACTAVDWCCTLQRCRKHVLLHMLACHWRDELS